MYTARFNTYLQRQLNTVQAAAAGLRARPTRWSPPRRQRSRHGEPPSQHGKPRRARAAPPEHEDEHTQQAGQHAARPAGRVERCERERRARHGLLGFDAEPGVRVGVGPERE